MAGAQDYVAVSFTGDSHDAVSAAQQLRRALKEVEAGAVSSSNTLAAAANRTVAEQAKQVRGSRELLEAYRRQAKVAEQGSAEQVAATRLAEREARKLGETVRVSSAQATRGFDESHGSLQRLVRGGIAGSGVFSSLGRQIAFASGSFLGGAGLVGAIASTVRVAADFQRSLNVMGAVSHATAQQMREVSAEAKRLGNDARLPATSARDAAVAMTELAKAGVSVDETLHAARGTLQLAAAAQIEERDAAQITARALNAFALSGTQATRVADVLASVANAASGEMGDFALALQQSSSVAHQVGLTLEDTVAALGRLAQAGLTGSDAGTSLRVMLQRLIPQTSKAAEEMAHLGITWKDAHGNILPLRDMISQYQTALGRLTPAERQHALQVIFGTDAQRAANILLLGGVDAFDRMRRAVTEHGAAAPLGCRTEQRLHGCA
jgi:TP901 family phage tail tape measure protein